MQQEIMFSAGQPNSAWNSHEGLPRGVVLELHFERSVRVHQMTNTQKELRKKEPMYKSSQRIEKEYLAHTQGQSGRGSQGTRQAGAPEGGGLICLTTASFCYFTFRFSLCSSRPEPVTTLRGTTFLASFFRIYHPGGYARTQCWNYFLVVQGFTITLAVPEKKEQRTNGNCD